MTASDCPLCRAPGASAIIWSDGRCRVVDAGDADYPGYCRVVWNEHVREMSDLAPAPRAHLMSVVDAVERALRDLLRPDKINLAALGNQVPHLHWHVIPRFADDPHFPDAIWAPRRRESKPRFVDHDALIHELTQRLSAR